MKGFRMMFRAAAPLAILLISGNAFRNSPAPVAQTGGTAEAPIQAGPTPGPQHELLARRVGVWDASIRIEGGAGERARISRGVETVTMECGGLWLVARLVGEMQGAPFEGRGTYGYDPATGRYIGAWVDSTSTFFWLSEGEYDEKTRTLTLWMGAPGPDGKMVAWRTTDRQKDKRTRVFTMYQPGPDGEEEPAMEITYKRRR